MDFYTLFPTIEPWVASLKHTFPASLLVDTVWGFAVVEAFHLLFLGLLGGAVILLNMRLIGVGMTDTTPSALEARLRPFIWAGIVGVLISGIIIGMLNPEKLYTSPAFFAKMIGLASALIFSLGVANAVSKRDGEVTMGVRIAAAVAFALWLWSIGVFGLSTGTNPGTFHMVVAGYVILLAFARPPVRIAGIAIPLVLALVYLVNGYFIVGGPMADYDAFMGQTKLLVQIAAVILVGLMGYEIFTGRASDTAPLAKLIGLFSILSWVTVAAAGRWIGLS